jgi:hypothetical protein
MLVEACATGWASMTWKGLHSVVTLTRLINEKGVFLSMQAMQSREARLEPNSSYQIKFMEYLVVGNDAQRYFADNIHEWSVVSTAST